MSKAWAWAQQLKEARMGVRAIEGARPEPSPMFYVSGMAKLRFAVSEEGFPQLIEVGSHGAVPHDIRFADDVENLLAAARWLLDTFKEAER